MKAAAETVGEVADHVAGGLGTTDTTRAEQPREPGASAPAYALRNLVVAERRRIAAAQVRLLKRQISFGQAAEDEAVRSGSQNRARLLGANIDLNKMEAGSHSAAGIFKTLMDRYKNAAKDAIGVRIVLDPEWQVVRAHISAPRGSKLAGQLLQDHSGSVRPQPAAPRAPCGLGARGARAVRGRDRRARGPAPRRPQREGRPVLRRVPAAAPHRRPPADPGAHRRLMSMDREVVHPAVSAASAIFPHRDTASG